MTFNYTINDIVDKLSNPDCSDEYIEEIHELMIKNNLSIEEAISNLRHMRIYFDYDDWIVDLINPWVKYLNEKNNTNYKKEEIKEFFFFSSIQNGMDFLLKEEDPYQYVKVREGILELFIELENNGLLNNVSIVTATVPETYLSKKKQYEKDIYNPLCEIFQHKFNKEFPLTYSDTFITTTKKELLNYNNAVLVDDAKHNVEKVVKINTYAYAMVVNHEHNQNLTTGDRIIRLNKTEDFFKILFLISLKSYDRRNDENKPHLKEEMFLKNDND